MAKKFFEEMAPALGGMKFQDINWFPGHMHKATKNLKSKLNEIDLFLEIRDARLPTSSKNKEIDEIMRLSQKNKIIIFNKYDLCNQNITSQICSNYNKVGIHSLTITATDGDNINKILNYVNEKQTIKFSTVGTWLMIGGMPNVGKSTLLNSLRTKYLKQTTSKRSVSKVTPIPCTTKSLVGYKINETPKIFLVDSPGIMVPKIIDNEVGLKLALIGCISDKITGKEPLIEYLVWALNKNRVKKHLEFYGMDFTPNSAKDLMFHVREKYKQFNYESTFDKILKDFREGKLGRITLDPIEYI